MEGVGVSAVDGGHRVFTRRRLLLATVLLVVVAVFAFVLPLWNGRGEYHCVPSASTMPDLVPTPAVSALGPEIERDPSHSAGGGCLPERSSYSIKARDGSPLGLTFSYERIEATWNHRGRVLTSQRFATLRPPDATHFDMSDELFGDEGYLAAVAREGYSRVELVIRDVNVFIRISYLVDQPLPLATETAKSLGDLMLDELNDFEYNGRGGA
jgi:hypothetical protein